LDERGTTVKYRGIAVGITKDGHPVQAFFANKKMAESWANTIVEAEKCPVVVYRIMEIQDSVYNPPVVPDAQLD
jgi:hypothetical protein